MKTFIAYIMRLSDPEWEGQMAFAFIAAKDRLECWFLCAGEGSWIWTSKHQEKEYLDFLTGFPRCGQKEMGKDEIWMLSTADGGVR